MSDLITPSTQQPSDQRAVWLTPEVVTMAAGDAENGVGPRSDDQVNKS
ncbi:MAG: hypothetical protein JWN21_459 [Sphingomonas bacterium]|nr:hypothetical protein [Sphingomonas bacterium]MDB5694916.1 hypothetical protein [Sphingomonas bacterium]